MTSPENPIPAPPSPNSSGEDAASPRSVMTSWIVALIVIGAFMVLFPAAAKTVAIFILTLSVLVFVHEWGHYQFARWGGMKVNRFAVGFPPWIYTKRKNGVDYSIGALPIGGMVDIAGLGSEEEMVATAKGESIANPTRTARRDVPHGERMFHEASLGWRFWTLFAGPLMNFIFAVVVFIGVFSIIGVPVADVTPKIDYVMPGSPAAKAGIKPGDTLLAVDSVRSNKTNDLALAIQNSKSKTVKMTLLRDGKEITLNLQPVVDELESPSGKVEKKPMIGVQFHDYIRGYEKVSFIDAAKLGWYQSYDITQRIFGFLGRAISNNLTNSDKRGVGGPVKIAQVIGNQADKGWLPVLLLAAGLSVNLGLMNLLPFPALDGGRILFLAYEFVMRRPFDPRKEGLVHMVGMVLLLAFMLFITIHDVLPMIRG
jgi:regulator of sigma E protease